MGKRPPKRSVEPPLGVRGLESYYAAAGGLLRGQQGHSVDTGPRVGAGAPAPAPQVGRDAGAADAGIPASPRLGSKRAASAQVVGDLRATLAVPQHPACSQEEPVVTWQEARPWAGGAAHASSSPAKRLRTALGVGPWVEQPVRAVGPLKATHGSPTRATTAVDAPAEGRWGRRPAPHHTGVSPDGAGVRSPVDRAGAALGAGGGAAPGSAGRGDLLRVLDAVERMVREGQEVDEATLHELGSTILHFGDVVTGQTPPEHADEEGKENVPPSAADASGGEVGEQLACATGRGMGPSQDSCTASRACRAVQGLSAGAHGGSQAHSGVPHACGPDRGGAGSQKPRVSLGTVDRQLLALMEAGLLDGPLMGGTGTAPPRECDSGRASTATAATQAVLPAPAAPPVHPRPRSPPPHFFARAAKALPETAPFAPSSSAPPPRPFRPRFPPLSDVRVVVESVEGPPGGDRLLACVVEATGARVHVALRGSWGDTPVEPGDACHVLPPGCLDPDAAVEREGGLIRWRATGSREDPWAVSDGGGALVLLPDALVAGTKVASSYWCMRRAVLEDRAQLTERNARAAAGTLVHDLFEAALVGGGVPEPAEAWVRRRAVEIRGRRAELLFESGLSDADAHRAIAAAGPAVACFSRACLGGGELGPGASLRGAVVEDVEEAVWAPTVGLKGVLDATVRGAVVEGREDVGGGVLAVELKTGWRMMREHYTQVSLYGLLLAERYGVDASRASLLVYLGGEGGGLTTEAVRMDAGAVAQMLQRRNEVAHAARVARRGGGLPPVLGGGDACKGCSSRAACGLVHAAEGGGPEPFGPPGALAEVVGHLSPTHLRFFADWERLLTLEEGSAPPRSHELWAVEARERERAGAGVAGLRAVGREPREGGGVAYLMERAGGAGDAGPVALGLGEQVIVSGDGGSRNVALCHVARGRLARATSGLLAVECDRPCRALDRALGAGDGTALWRLDADAIYGTLARVRGNLVELMVDGGDRAARLRELVVDLRPPGPVDAAQGGAAAAVPGLNAEQREAVRAALGCRDYALVLGMPGSGKTRAIVEVVRAAAAAGGGVLVAAYTNSAVDNVALRLAAAGVAFVRVGRPATTHPGVRPHLLGSARWPARTAAALRDLSARSPLVVLATCLTAAQSPLVRRRAFDLCVLDEAGQVTLPAALGALLRARRFVLVGDHFQLPPLVASDEARAGGLGTSLFQRLCDAHPGAVATLASQYRMCGPIMALANDLVYRGQLRPGSPEVEAARLSLRPPLQPRDPLPDWAAPILSPEPPVLLVDTDAASGFGESALEGGVVNAGEAALAAALVAAWVAAGVSAAGVACLTPYRAQSARMEAEIRARLGSEAGGAVTGEGLSMTVDKAQGLDKEVVVLSLVRSNPDGHVGSLLTDWRRLNVAMTRAQRKLVILGSPATLRRGEVPFLTALLEAAEARGGRYALPMGADGLSLSRLGSSAAA